jgi:hypothetical protein
MNVAGVASMVAILAMLGGCNKSREVDAVVPAKNPITLSADLEHELAAVRADPVDAIGYGAKAYMPYELRRGKELMYGSAAEVTARLSAEARDSDNPRTFRLAALQILARRNDPAVDAALTAALSDPVLRPLAAFLIGRIGFKGYPERERDTAALARALVPYFDDRSTFDDPWYHRSWSTQQIVIGAYVRLTGPDRFTFVDPDAEDFIGWQLPALSDADTSGLLMQCRARAGSPP